MKIIKKKNIKEKEYKRKRKYQLENKQLIKERLNIRLSNDILYSIKRFINSKISTTFFKKGLKKDKKAEDILGCSFEEFKIYLENKFEPWMNWNNRGIFNNEYDYGWDVDHIIPISTAITKEDLYKLNHYTNLQPLCSKFNRHIKKDNIHKKLCNK